MTTAFSKKISSLAELQIKSVRFCKLYNFGILGIYPNISSIL